MNPVITDRLILPFVINFFLFFGVVGLTLGITLIVNPVGVARLFQSTNRWVSMRTRTKWLEVPRNTETFWRRHRLPLGVAAMLLGAFSVFALMVNVDTGRVAGLIQSGAPQSFVAWIVESVLLFLMLGNGLAVIVGILLVFAPDQLDALEKRTNAWYSTRQRTRGAETRYMNLDRLTEHHPRAMGWSVTVASLLLIVQFGMLLVSRH